VDSIKTPGKSFRHGEIPAYHNDPFTNPKWVPEGVGFTQPYGDWLLVHANIVVFTEN
jgi:hypothetical protein